MKNIKYILSLLMLLPFISSCEKDIMDYEGETGLYFDVQWDTNPKDNTDSTRWIRQHYTLANFASGSGVETEKIVGLKIAVAGSVVNYDRPISYKVVEDSTTAILNEEYEIVEEPYIPAGKNHTFLKVKALRTERMLEETLKLQIQLLPNEHFTLPFEKVGYINGRFPNDAESEYSTYDHANVHNVFINNMLVKPAGWHNVQFGYYYSKKKYELLLKLAYETNGWGIEEFEDRKKMQAGRAEAIARFARIYLMEEYKKGREHWVLDDDGSMMYVAGVTRIEGQNPDEMVDN